MCSLGGVWESGDTATVLTDVTSEIDGDQWSASYPAAIPLGKSPRNSLDRKPSWSQSRSESCRGEKNPIPLTGIEPRPSGL
jgi:hypothetical protein